MAVAMGPVGDVRMFEAPAQETLIDHVLSTYERLGRQISRAKFLRLAHFAKDMGWFQVSRVLLFVFPSA